MSAAGQPPTMSSVRTLARETKRHSTEAFCFIMGRSLTVAFFLWGRGGGDLDQTKSTPATLGDPSFEILQSGWVPN